MPLIQIGENKTFIAVVQTTAKAVQQGSYRTVWEFKM